ncbi:MAG TPA: hypothetical protein VF571_09150 [Pyrinomonadaceae bacterium]
MSDMQEMAIIISRFKDLHFRPPTQAEVRAIFQERKAARETKPAEEPKFSQLNLIN